MNKKAVGAIIREARKAIGLTQAELAEKLGVEPPSVTRWETGASSPRPKMIPKIESILNIDIQKASKEMTTYQLDAIQKRMSQLELMIKNKSTIDSTEESRLFTKYRHIIERLEKGSDLDLEIVEEALGLSANDRASGSDSA